MKKRYSQRDYLTRALRLLILQCSALGPVEFVLFYEAPKIVHMQMRKSRGDYAKPGVISFVSTPNFANWLAAIYCFTDYFILCGLHH